MRSRMPSRVGATLLAACALTVAVVTSVAAAGHGSADYVLLVDCTGTMQHANRGTATLDAIESFVGLLNKGDRVTVYGYGEKPFPALMDYPVTIGSDETSRKAITDELRLPFTANRTDITRGLELVWQERGRVFSRALSGESVTRGAGAYVILLTDGKLIPVYDNYAQYDEIYHESRTRLRQLGRLFADAGIPIYSVGLGRAEKVDGELLTQVSESSGGVYRHASSSDRLPAVFKSLGEDVIAPPIAVVEESGEDVPVTAEAASITEGNPRRGILDGIVESASATETSRMNQTSQMNQTNRVEIALSQSFGDLGPQIYQAIIGVLGVMMGFVAIGVHRRQSWAGFFMKPLLQKEMRVKGYLRRIPPEGVVAALSNIPIENRGLPTIEIGMGTDYAAELRRTLIEFVGTADGSPPLLRVLSGSVLVAGEPVEDVRTLANGDIIECEGKAYEYLRGQRR